MTYEEKVCQRAEEFAQSTFGFNELSNWGKRDAIEDLKAIAVISIQREADAIKSALLSFHNSIYNYDTGGWHLIHYLTKVGLIPPKTETT